MRHEDLFALSWTLCRLKLSTMETAAVWWLVAVRELWMPHAVARGPGPSLAETVRQTRREAFERDEGPQRE